MPVWYEHIDRVDFLKKLYIEIPTLDCVRLLEASVFPVEKRLIIRFALLQPPDWIPAKWKSKRGNAVKIELSFWCVSHSEIKMDSDIKSANIVISNDCEGCLKVCATGSVNVLAIAEVGAVSNIELIYM